MSDFKARMHQIRFRLGLRPRPRWRSLQRSPRLPSWISGGLLLRGGEGGEGNGEREVKEGMGKRKGEGGEKGRERNGERDGRESLGGKGDKGKG